MEGEKENLAEEKKGKEIMKMSNWKQGVLLNPAIYVAISLLYAVTLSQRIPVIANYIVTGILVALTLVLAILDFIRQFRKVWDKRPWKKS